jgi:dTDP-4-amino-4,6-dideoxygalactose transaminase
MDLNIFSKFVREKFKTNEFIPLHVPTFIGNEEKYVGKTIKSTFVSSVGKYVDQFELDLASIIKVKRSVAVVNGTSALQVALR